MFHIENIWWNKYSSSVRQYAAPLCVFECYLLGVNSFWHQPKRHEIFACYFSKKLKINIYKKMQWWTINYFLYQTISEIINIFRLCSASKDWQKWSYLKYWWYLNDPNTKIAQIVTFHELGDMLKTIDNMDNERAIFDLTFPFSLILLLKYAEVLRHSWLSFLNLKRHLFYAIFRE